MGMRLKMRSWFKKVCSRFGKSYESKCGASVGTNKKLFKIRESERERELHYGTLASSIFFIRTNERKQNWYPMGKNCSVVTCLTYIHIFSQLTLHLAIRFALSLQWQL